MTSPRLPLSRPSTSASVLLRDVARLHVRAQRALLVCEANSVTQCTMLTELGRAQPCTLATLTRRLRLDKAWISRAIDQMVSDGLVRKAAGLEDGRTITLSLTRSGAAQLRRLEAALNGQVSRVIGRIPRSERGGVTRALELLHAAYVVELTEPGESPLGVDPEVAACV